MIPASAVKHFLAEPRDDHRWLKKLKHVELDRLLDKFDPPPEPWHKLGLHQKVCLYLGIEYGSLALWLDMGVGKTLASLELLQYWWDSRVMRRALVFVTSDKAFPTWERQIKQYQISVPYIALDESSSEDKWRRLSGFDQGIVLLTYPGAVAMVSQRNKKKKRMEFVDKEIKRLLHEVDVVVLDESTRCGNHDSLTYRLCKRASNAAEFCYALSGMPFGRDPTPLWSQCFLVDHGATLGPTLGLFREAFFTASQNEWGGPYSMDYTFKSSMKPKLSQILQHRSITYTADECIDLPPVMRFIEEVKLPAATREYYRKVVEQIIVAKGNLREMKNAFLKMRQLSSGFIGLKDDETGERAQVEFDQNPKLDRLLELIESLPLDRKALVFYDFTHSGRRITEELKKIKLNPIWLWSGTKNPKQAMQDFIEDPDTTVAVINNRVGAYSLDGLQVANYEFFYESPVSVMDRNQAERRIRRQGQQHKVFYYDLVVKDTVDAKILDFHREGEDLFKSLLRNPSQVIRF